MSNKIETQQIAKEILISLFENKILNHDDLVPPTEACAKNLDTLMQNLSEIYETIHKAVEKQQSHQS